MSRLRIDGRTIARGEGVVHAVPRTRQDDWIEAQLAPGAPGVWLEHDTQRWRPGEADFHRRVGVVLHGCGMVANLSLRENLLLPLLHHGGAIEQASAEAERLAARWGMADRLDRRVGGCAPFEHALGALLRCRLQQAWFVVVEDVFVGLRAAERARVRAAFAETVEALHAGWIWLAADPSAVAQALAQGEEEIA